MQVQERVLRTGDETTPQRAVVAMAGQQAMAPVAVRAGAVGPGPWNGIVLLAGYHFLIAALFVMGTMLVMIPVAILGILGLSENPALFFPAAILTVVAFVLMLLCLINLIVGYGLWTRRVWGRIGALALAFLRLVNVPVGTVIGGMAIWYLLREDVGDQFRE